MLVPWRILSMIVCLSLIVPSEMLLLPPSLTQLTTKLIGISLGVFPATFISMHPPIFPTHLILSVENPPSGTATIYRSGKNPYPIDKNDPKKGTKKDYSFLKCVSNCKSDCELPSDGLVTQRVVTRLDSFFCFTRMTILSYRIVFKTARTSAVRRTR